MKLPFFGSFVLAVGSLIGYGGSYTYDKFSGSSQIESTQQELKYEETKEVLSESTTTGDVVPETLENIATYPATHSATVIFEATLSATLVPSPTVIQKKSSSSEEINGFIEKYASEYGVDPNILRHIAVCESGFNPEAANKNYAGLFQFSPATWKSNRKDMNLNDDINLRYDAEESVKTAAFMLSTGKRHSWPMC